MRNHNGEPVLEARGLGQVYRSGQGDLAALEDVSLQVRGGEFVAIVGPSGCGKSTLLRILGGLLVPTAGAVYLDGRPLTSPQRQVAYVFQNVNLLPWRTVLRNVLLPLEVGGTARAEAVSRAENVCLLYTSPSPRDRTRSRMPSSA